jgi:hypothetical protein
MEQETTEKKLQALVKEEATALRHFATENELKKLNFDHLNSQNRTDCVYGQIAGDCTNERALDLIRKCAGKCFLSNGRTPERSIMNSAVNPGKLTSKERYSIGATRPYGFFSPIECFIDILENQKNGNNRRLISYLKGETDTLEFA